MKIHLRLKIGGKRLHQGYKRVNSLNWILDFEYFLLLSLNVISLLALFSFRFACGGGFDQTF